MKRNGRMIYSIFTVDKLNVKEVFAHFVGEIFNPGGYFESQKPAYFFRWQVDFKF